MKPETSNLASRWGLPKLIIKSHAEEKWACPGTLKILQFTFIISATAKASDFKFGSQLEFAKGHHKITQRKKWALPWARGLPKIWGSPLIFLQR